MALAPQSRRVSGMTPVPAGPGTVAGPAMVVHSSGMNGGRHPYAAVDPGLHLRAPSQGQPGQGRYHGMHDPTTTNAIGAATMAAARAEGMGMQDGSGGEQKDRRGFWGVLCCR